MQIEEYNSNVFLVKFRFPMGLGSYLPAKTFILKSDVDNSVDIVSPGPLTEEIYAEIEKRWKVRSLIAPNLLHHLSLKKAHDRFPQAQLVGPKYIEKKQPWMQGKYQMHEDWQPLPGFEKFKIEGIPGLREMVLFHRQSGTFIAVDLFFNLVKDISFVSSLFLRPLGTYKRLAVSRLLKMLIKDKAKFKSSMKVVTDLPLKSAIPAHGEPTTDMQRFREIFS